jgi:hypothetical protein
MRRTSATQLLAPATAPVLRLADMRCSTCGFSCSGAEAVVALASGPNGANERAWCSIACARSHGWPFLTSTRAGEAEQARMAV